MIEKAKLQWKVHVPCLLEEIAGAGGLGGVFRVPLNVLRILLGRVADRAAEINDPKLNRLMCRMALYNQADPDSPDYDAEAMREMRL